MMLELIFSFYARTVNSGLDFATGNIMADIIYIRPNNSSKMFVHPIKDVTWQNCTLLYMYKLLTITVCIFYIPNNNPSPSNDK